MGNNLATSGTDTTAHALVTGTWNLLNDKAQMSKLREELFEAIPDPGVGSALDWPALEKLDYLVCQSCPSPANLTHMLFSME